MTNLEKMECRNCSYTHNDHFEDGQCPILGIEKTYFEREK